MTTELSQHDIRDEINEKIRELEKDKIEAKEAAIDILEKLKDHRVVCACAETQMGKTTICRLIAKRTIAKLSNEHLDRLEHKVVVYIENVANNDLAAQADDNFSHLSENVEVVSVTRASDLLDTLPDTHGILFMIDESHMGCDHLAKRLNEILAKIEARKNIDDKILLVSATGFSSIYEASKERSIMGYSAAIRVVQPPKAYRGISQFLADNQIINNSDESCLVKAKFRTAETFNKFKDTLTSNKGGVWIIRSSAGNTQQTKDMLLELKDSQGQPILLPENIKIVASSLNDVEKDDLESWNKVLKSYNSYLKRNLKLVIIVRGFLRVGIAMPPKMKKKLIATWDGTSSAVSSVVQALIGRACGYHENNTALHFAHKNMLKAHDELNRELNKLSEPPEVLFDHVAQTIQNITSKYDIPIWDPGLAGTDRATKKSRLETKLTTPQYSVDGWAAYSFDPNTKLRASEEDILGLAQKLNNNPSYQSTDKETQELGELISKVHGQFRANTKGEIPVKTGRRMNKMPYVSGQFINKKTFINAKHGQRRKLEMALSDFDNGIEVSFNGVRTQGARAKKIKDIEYITYVISTYNAARGTEPKSQSQLTMEMMEPFCKAYGIEPNNTVVLIFKRSKKASQSLTQAVQIELDEQANLIERDGNLLRKSGYGKDYKSENETQ